MTQQKVDGHEAYRDDPEYTAPEMQPFVVSDDALPATPDVAALSVAGLSIGAGGGALAGQALHDEMEDEIEEGRPSREPAAG